MKKRFPGADRLELVRVLFWPEERAGTCWTEIDPAGKMPLEARYAVGNGAEEDFTATSFGELRRQGWKGIYRTPAGTGFEHRAAFRSIDLTVNAEYRCRCFSRDEVEEGARIPVRLRMRWQGPAHMPEVSARSGLDGKPVGLKAGFSTGHLFTYEFPVRAPYPKGHYGQCGGNAVVAVLLAPPML